MNRSLRSVGRSERFHHLLDVLHPVSRTHHHRIGGLNHYQILYAQRGDQTTLAAHIVISGIV